MTIAESWGKFSCTLEHVSFGKRSREVEFDVEWVSCGVYNLQYWRPRDAEDHEVMVTEDWYPPNTSICFTPEQFEKAWELYPSAPKHSRIEAYKPYYENYELDTGTFDFCHDNLFQAFKDGREDEDRVYLVRRHFVMGIPQTHDSVLGLSFEDFRRLKEFLDSKKDMIFYSGCYVASPSKLVGELAAALSD